MDGDAMGTPTWALSRSLYRELVPRLPDFGTADRTRRERRSLLEACEASMERLVFDPDACVNPARSLFREIRHLFAIDVQADVWKVTRFHVTVGRSLASRLESSLRRECQAITRQGTPCRREPTAGRRFCPSHYSLEDALAQTEASDAVEAELVTVA
jgi:hypothetical protein